MNSSFFRAILFAKSFKRHIATTAGIALLLAGVNATEPLVLKYIFDRIGATDPLRAVAVGVGLLLGLGVAREIADAVSSWLTWRTRLGIHYNLLEKTVERLHHQPLDFYRKDGSGAILTKLDRSIHGFIEAVTRLLFQVFPALVYLLIAAIVMMRLSPRLAWVVLLFAPLPAFIQAQAAPRQIRRERTLLDRWARIYSRFNEVLSGIVTVRSFSMEHRERDRFLTHVAEANRLVIDGVERDARTTALANLTVMLARVVSIAMGCVLVVRGHITLGTLVAFLGYLSGLFGPVQGLSGIYQALRVARVSLDEIFTILDTEGEIVDRPGALAPARARGAVALENVTFRYHPALRPVLDRVDLTVRPGEMVAIVGPSGAGKTTMAALLMRLYDPQEGAVRIDGRDVRDLKQDWLRGAIAVVLQDPLLFNDTVRNNIAYGRPDASTRAVEAAARAANAHEFIGRLPDAYATMVGERGGRLSLGERQRVTIARALVKDAPILILDEATSSLDAESEAQVQEALDRLTRGRTVFVIAHRLSTVVRADRILVLREGRVAEEGTHRELMALEGYYASLVTRQTAGLLATRTAAPSRRRTPRTPRSDAAGWYGEAGSRSPRG